MVRKMVEKTAQRRDNFLYDKFLKEGYVSITDFMKRSGCPITFETVRVAVYEGRAVSDPSLIIIMKYLNFTANEIRDALANRGEKEFSSLIGGQGKELKEWESTLIKILRSIRESDHDFWNTLIEFIQLISTKCLGIREYREEIKRLYMKQRRNY